MFPLWTAFLVAIALVAGGVWVYRRYFRKVSGREDRYTPERILTPEQVAMLDYLRDTFPDQVVLPNVPLQNMLSVRRSADIQRAKERLKTQKVDFVVCDADGRAVFAFDVEQYHLSDAKAKAHQVKIKNRILKTAGVRFLFLKNSIHRMPTPNDFRRQLDLAALPRPKAQDGESNNGESVRQQLLLESPQPISEAPAFDTNRTLEEMTRELVEIALRRVHGNQSQAAVQLGVSRSTLWRMQHKEK